MGVGSWPVSKGFWGKDVMEEKEGEEDGEAGARFNMLCV